MKLLPHIILMLAAVLLVAADKKDEKTKPSPVQIQLWIKQLSDKDFKVREEATGNLIKAGGVAFEAVTKATKSKDAELKQRAMRIIKKLVRANLLGTWKVTSMEYNGKQTKYKKTTNFSFIIAENTITVSEVFGDAKKHPKVTFKIDETKNPKQITLFVAATKEHDGDTILGIFRQQGDRLELCFDGLLYRLKQRPTEFNAKENVPQMYFTLKRLR